MLQFRSDDTVKWLEGFGNRAEGDATPSGTFGNAKTPFTGTQDASTGTVGSNSGFSIGDLVFIHQSRNGGDGAGVHQLNRITDISGTTFTFKYPLQHDFATTAQIIRIAQSRNITINGTLTAPAWDGSVGGIIVLMGDSINGSGTIDLLGKGYRGGQQSSSGNVSGQAGEGTTAASSDTHDSGNNGGGGGRSNGVGNSGAGGGHVSQASNGPRHFEFSADGSATLAVGGIAVGNAGLTVMVFGGGGGAGGKDSGSGEQSTGHGGIGGGILVIICRAIDLSSMTIVRTGGTDGGYNSENHNGGGGGAAAGSILLKGQTIILGSNKLTALAGNGSWGCATQHSNLATNGTNGRIHADILDTDNLSGTTNPTIDVREDSTLVDPGGAFLGLI